MIFVSGQGEGLIFRTFLCIVFGFPIFCYCQDAKISTNAAAFKMIGVDSSFKKLEGKKSIRVAIIDDAFDIDNSSLSFFLDANKAEIPGNGFDDDGNGKTDDYSGWDFANNDNDVRPPAAKLKTIFHGTKVADIFVQAISAVLQNPSATIKILPIKANADNSQNNYITDGYKAIQYALAMKVDMIVCSWSFFELKENEQALLEKARAHGVIIVASAGNLLYEQPQYPASFHWAINVAAVDNDLHKHPASNFGQGIDISAPGDSLMVFASAANQPPAYISATSAAAPFAAGIIAAISSAFPQLEAAEVDRAIKNSAIAIDSLNGQYSGKLGAGIINVPGLINYLTSGKVPTTYTQPKAYLDLEALPAGETYTIMPFGKYKSIKLVMQPGMVPEENIAVKWLYNEARKDTVLTPAQIPYPLTLKADKLWVQHSGMDKRNGTGKALWYYEVQTTDSSTLYCTGTTNIEGTEGEIADGSGDANYTGRSDCKWLIKVPEGKKIQINFTEMDLEARKDQVYIFNGLQTNAPIAAIFSGQKIPPVVTSWGNMVLIWFISNETNHGKGWELHYKAVD